MWTRFTQASARRPTHPRCTPDVLHDFPIFAAGSEGRRHTHPVSSPAVTATNHTNDFFKIVDLNPPAGAGVAPVTDPRDPRGQMWFGFVSQGQRLSLEFGTNPPPAGLRVLYTFDLEYFSGVGVGVTPPPAAKPHGVLQMNSPTDQDQMYVMHHNREYVALWIDPTGTQPTTGQTVQVAVKAWRQD